MLSDNELSSSERLWVLSVRFFACFYFCFIDLYIFGGQGGAPKETVIVEENGIGDASSNSARGCLYFSSSLYFCEK